MVENMTLLNKLPLISNLCSRVLSSNIDDPHIDYNTETKTGSPACGKYLPTWSDPCVYIYGVHNWVQIQEMLHLGPGICTQITISRRAVQFSDF